MSVKLIEEYKKEVRSYYKKEENRTFENGFTLGFDQCNILWGEITRCGEELTSFSQLWGSTSLGFGGWGCSSMCEAMTTIVKIREEEKYYVLFSGQIAYVVENPNANFFEDIKDKNMVSCRKAKERYE